MGEVARTGASVHMMSQGPRVPSVPDAKAAWGGDGRRASSACFSGSWKCPGLPVLGQVGMQPA